MASEWQVLPWLDSRLVRQKDLQRDSCLFDSRRRITQRISPIRPVPRAFRTCRWMGGGRLNLW